MMLDGGLPILYPLCKTEIDQLAPTILPKDDVVQFDVSVDDALGVEVVEACKHV